MLIDSWPPTTAISESPLTMRLVAQRHRAQTRAAKLVDAPGRHLNRNTGVDRGLPGRALALSRLKNLTQYHFGHARRFDASAVDCSFDRDLTEVVGRRRSERPVECADRRAYRADNDDVVLHTMSFRVCSGAMTRQRRADIDICHTDVTAIDKARTRGILPCRRGLVCPPPPVLKPVLIRLATSLANGLANALLLTFLQTSPETAHKTVARPPESAYFTRQAAPASYQNPRPQP